MEQIYHFSAPGRTELGGNHTDHQHGLVLAAAVDLETVAQVQRNGTDRICVRSQGYPEVCVQIGDWAVRTEEKNTTGALVRGVAAAFSQRGVKPEGLDISVTSQILPGSGLSSSAAFEVLLGRIWNALFAQGRFTPVEIAQIGQYAENVYFGKPCGLMDQLTSSVGGTVFMDFGEEMPKVESLALDLREAGYGLCILHTGADHADLTEEYAAITRELGAVCAFFGKRFLRQVPEADFLAALPELKKAVSQRAILRAMHIYRENERVLAQKEALVAGDVARFLELVNRSGESSWMYLQNIVPTGATEQQPVAFALMLCKHLLRGSGACRVHGGGFAGTVQAFVPLDMLENFRTEVETVLGAGSCQVLALEKKKK